MHNVSWQIREYVMKHTWLPAVRFVVLVLACGLHFGNAADAADDRLKRQTQELYDAIAPGHATVWEHYLDANCRYTSEDGEVFNKAQMVAQTKPLPTGVTGSIKVIYVQVTHHGTVAITNYIADEDENYHGHLLHAQYRSTDTWTKSSAGWRLIASQALALRTDPPAMDLDVKHAREYVGRYVLAPGVAYEIRQNGESLEGQQTGRPTEKLRAEAIDVFFAPGKPRYRRIFLRGADGRITGFAERRESWQMVWKRES